MPPGLPGRARRSGRLSPRFAVPLLVVGVLLVASAAPAGAGMGKIQAARLTKTTFGAAAAAKVRLLYVFASPSKRFELELAVRNGASWQVLRDVGRHGSFSGAHSLTVKSLFQSRPIKAGSYRLELAADANRVRIGFRVAATVTVTQARNNRPAGTVKLVFVHHSTGQNWLDDSNGELGIALRNNNYFVSDTNYGWGPDSIGDRTDIGQWWLWFRGARSATYMHALYNEFGQNSTYARLARDPDPTRENQVILFKSCFPNSNISGNPSDPPATGANPLRGKDASLPYMTVANVEGIYNDLLPYFAAHQGKLFILIVSPPLRREDTTAANAANARAVADWLVNKWLARYPYRNVGVYDFFNVLTSNGGSPDVNDLGKESGNHHRRWNGRIEDTKTVSSNFTAYPTSDSHPSRAGNLKATGEFVDVLNYYYQRWSAKR